MLGVTVPEKIRSNIYRGHYPKAVRTIKDEQIIAMLQRRDEAALHAMRRKYGRNAERTAKKILGNIQDAEEVLNDALLRIWNAIPPEHPENLGAYFTSAVQRLALNRLEKRNTAKRGGGLTEMPQEAAEQIAAPGQIEQIVEQSMMRDALQAFLDTLSPDARTVFVLRYTAEMTVPEIAKRCGFTESKVAVSLMRTRAKLKQYLKKEGWL